MNISIETPALLFSATSLILLAYTNRFLAIASIVRNLKAEFDSQGNSLILEQIKSLSLRISLIRYMQLCGVISLFAGAMSMMCLFLDYHDFGLVLFGFSLLLLLISLVLSAWEISISVKALRLSLSDLEEFDKKK